VWLEVKQFVTKVDILSVQETMNKKIIVVIKMVVE